MDESLLSNQKKPLTDATLTVRVIKSFTHRNYKNLVLRNLDLENTGVEDLIKICKDKILNGEGWKAYQNVKLADTLKLYTHAHGSKTTNLIINLDHPEWILDNNNNIPLSKLSIEHESELSLFNRQDYESFLLDPQQTW
ncbi:hypothetical protein BY996DRAFT_4580307 [Phakopsora pachyrhizi]|uniref:Uncharacterized protein n=1 Tax=Phakopsora pachyrhizi TaxID=170000 RepID=A0AAV0BS53_PHAPC|nr:hypothetical protein BY996DRAFT_4580307 [Phakopsora pachyrhizi]CAH7689502.1 hypothetical protein PPACK8108_LOCUS24589 [Phakopsora pachyrhizi]